MHDRPEVFVRDAEQRHEQRARAADQLKSFCRGELSAIETYGQAIDVITDSGTLIQLQRNLASHQARVAMLRDRILELGEEPPESSGPWGVLAMAMEGTAGVIGEKSALSILEEGERHGEADYQSDLSVLDPLSRQMVEDDILPQQLQTHRSLVDIRRSWP